MQSDLTRAAARLRTVLATPCPYDFGDGSGQTLTTGQVFFRLYADYDAAKAAWSAEQQDKQQTLEAMYPSTRPSDNEKRMNGYLQWYEATAAPRIAGMMEKQSLARSVFSPEDVAVITDIISSPVGQALAQAEPVPHRVFISGAPLAGSPDVDAGAVAAFIKAFQTLMYDV
jgi:hypothetical protein